MLETLKLIAFALIGISVIWKIIALVTLNNKNIDFSIRQKKYLIWDGICYLFLIPGIILFVYVTMHS